MPVALALLPELLIGLVLFLLIWACRAMFGQMFNSLGSRIPLLGSVIGTVADAIIADITTWAVQNADSALNGMVGLVLAPVYWIEHIIADVMGVIDAIGNALGYIVNTLIQYAINIAIAEAQVLVARAVNLLESLVNNVYRVVQTEFTQVYATITAVEHALLAYDQALFQAAENYTTSAIRAETAFVVSVEQALEHEITAAISAETAFVENEVKAAIAYTTTVAGELTSAIEHEAGAITSWVAGELGILTGEVNAALASTLAISLAETAVVAKALETLETECTDNLCSGLTEAANLANGLMAQGWIAAMLGYAAWCASDPEGAGNATASVLAPIASAAVDGVGSAASFL